VCADCADHVVVLAHDAVRDVQGSQVLSEEGWECYRDVQGSQVLSEEGWEC
jgi:hypothetical protein